MLLSMLALYYKHFEQFGFYSFALDDLMNVTIISPEMQIWLFWGFFIAFAIKVPMFPVHTWLPDAHTEAPHGGIGHPGGHSVEDGAVRHCAVRNSASSPGAATDDQTVQIVSWLSIIAIVYGALVSLMQKDWKRLVAYSSVSHLGFCTLGANRPQPERHRGRGASKGSTTASRRLLLFLIVGIVYEQRHTRAIAEYGGLANRMPIFTVIFAIAMLASAGMPGLNGFIGEFTILRGSFREERLLGGIRRARHRARSGLFAVAFPTHDAGADHQPEERRAARHEPARNLRDGTAGFVVLLDRTLSQAVFSRSSKSRWRKSSSGLIPATSRETACRIPLDASTAVARLTGSDVGKP